MTLNIRNWLDGNSAEARRAHTLLDEEQYTRLDTHINGVQVGHWLMHEMGATSEDAIDLLRAMNIPIPANQAATENIVANSILENTPRYEILLQSMAIGVLLHDMQDWNIIQQRVSEQYTGDLLGALTQDTSPSDWN